MTTHTVTTTKGVKIAYKVYGEGGPLLMLVMGLGMPGDIWKPLVERLLANQQMTIVVPDNRGTGHSKPPNTPWLMTDMGDDAAAVLRDVNRGPAVVCGVSLGGMVTQNLAIRHPDLIKGLVLCNTTCGLPTGKFLSPEALSILLRLALFPQAASEALAHKLLAHPNSTGIMNTYQENVARGMGTHPTTTRGMFFQLLAALSHNTGKALHTIEAPTTVIGAAADYLIPVENSRILAKRIPNATLRIVEEAGHILPHECPEVIETATLQMLEMTS